MRKLVVLAVLIGLISGQDLDSLECPFPGGPATSSEERCYSYSACVWKGTRCAMENNSLAGYSVVSIQDTQTGFMASLQKIDPTITMFDADLQEIVFEVINQEDAHLQIKIYDPAAARYEVPYKLNLPEGAGLNPLYDVTISDIGEPFTFSVQRVDTGTVIFNMLGPLTFEDQFIQVTTALSSSYLYGFGENSHYTFKHDFSTPSTSALWPRDEPIGPENVNHYGFQPYYVNIEDDSGNIHSVLFYNSNAFEYRTFSLDDGTPAVTMRTIGGIVDLNLFLGPSLEDVNQQYTNVVGKPNLPIYWSLGFQLSRYGYTYDDVVDVRQRMKAAGVPQDGQVLDIDYMYRYRDFTYDPVNWANLPSLVDDLHADNVSLTLIIEPAVVIDPEYEPSQRGVDVDAFIRWSSTDFVPADQETGWADMMIGYVWPDVKTVFADYLKPSAVEWWIQESITFHEEIEFDGYWVDMNEPANFGTNLDRPWNYPEGLDDWSLKCPYSKYDDPPYPTIDSYMDINGCKRISDKTLCLEASQTDGTDSFLRYDVHPLYGISMSIASYQALEAIFPGKRPFVLSRSNFPGSGQYIAHWTGDNTANWDNLRNSIIGVLEFNLFGIPHVGSDICGFFNEPSEELCARWMAAGAFFPFSRNHNTINEPAQDPAREDWPLVTSASIYALNLRYKYLPYLYTLFYRAHIDGGSVVRPLFSLFPSDMETRTIQDQFLWGTGMMISPVVEESALSKDVYFPEGTWYELQTGALTAIGPLTVTVDAPVDYIPVYARGGVILPTQEPAINTKLSRLNPFGLTVALDSAGEAYGELFWDDGETLYDEQQSYFASISYTNNTLSLLVERDTAATIGLSFETVKVYGYSSSLPGVIINGVQLDQDSVQLVEQVLSLSFKSPLSDDLTIVISS